MYIRSVLSSYMFDSFFFFKQKTAYELRISDWSSDVCSSDLDGEGEDVLVPIAPRDRLGHADHAGLGGGIVPMLRRIAAIGGAARDIDEATAAQIGRASGRGRVWQYV